jgi:hypothetical protein
MPVSSNACATWLAAGFPSALSRNQDRDVADDDLLDELVLPAIAKHRDEWDAPVVR